MNCPQSPLDGVGVGGRSRSAGKNRLGDERMAINVLGDSSGGVGVGFQEVVAGVGVVVERAVDVFADAFAVVGVLITGFTGGLRGLG